MPLALETGWTPDVIRDLPNAFRAGCHWMLYARSLVGPDGLPSTDIPAEAPLATRLAMQKARVGVMKAREHLFPEDDDV